MLFSYKKAFYPTILEKNKEFLSVFKICGTGTHNRYTLQNYNILLR